VEDDDALIFYKKISLEEKSFLTGSYSLKSINI
jgi:hypothetical protein